MKIFEIGDKVRVIDNNRYGFTNMDNHTEGIIRERYLVNNIYNIEITRCDATYFIGCKVNFDDDEIELIDDENPTVDLCSIHLDIDKDGCHVYKIGEKEICSISKSPTEVNTELKVKGENKMNKVLNLYYENHLKEINDKYNELIKKDYSEITVVKEYKELIENFEKQLTDLFTKSVIEEIPFGEVTSYNVYRFEPDECEIKDKIAAKYQEKKSSELKTLMELRDEVEAQLSLSDNVDYQLDVLKRYDIINKKTGRIN